MVKTSASPPLVLLHGLGRTRWSLWPLRARQLGADSPSTTSAIRRDVPRSKSSLRTSGVACGVSRNGGVVDVVTHSMGGIVLRAAVAAGNVPAESVRRVVMLAPPNHGSQLADRLSDYLVYRLALGPAAQQIGTGEHSVPRRLPPPPFEVGIIAGRRAANPFFARVLGDESDGKVTVASAQLEGMRELVVVDRSHTFIMWAPDVLAHIFSFLDTGRFAPANE